MVNKNSSKSKADIFQNLNTKNEEALVKKLAWKQASSHMKGPQHPDDIEDAISKSKKIFRNILSQRKIERAKRSKSQIKKTPVKKASIKSSVKKPVSKKKHVVKSHVKKPVSKKKHVVKSRVKKTVVKKKPVTKSRTKKHRVN
jgi:hypothetical protein